MLNFLSLKIVIGLIVSMMSFLVLYFINDYMHLKSAYKISQKTINILEHKRLVLDKEMVNIERIQNENYDNQKNMLLEMDKKGYINTRDGLNPIWMQSESKSIN